jgi:hypothetical protein
VSYKELGKAVEKLPSHLPTDLKNRFTKCFYQVENAGGKIIERKNDR